MAVQRGKWCSCVREPLRPKSRGLNASQMGCGVGLGPGWHGERPGPARCDQEDSLSNSLSRRDVMAAQAGQLDHLDDIGPPPAS